MGVYYYQCYLCGECPYEENIQRITIEKYGDDERICVDCMDESSGYFVAKPRDDLEIEDDAFTFEIASEHTKQEFDSLKELEQCIAASTDVRVEFGIKGNGPMTTSIDELRTKCRRIVWESIPHHDDDDTDFFPTAAFWQKEKDRVGQEVEKWTKRRKIIDEK